ncbi:MAG: hypothetical protein LBB98_11700 [Treponema sp.]|jgi:hypothetical protein|nr:hypothetical protein [Treponema sp.]
MNHKGEEGARRKDKAKEAKPLCAFVVRILLVFFCHQEIWSRQGTGIPAAIKAWLCLTLREAVSHS